MPNDGNAWCRILGIDVPSLSDVGTHPRASTFAMAVVALLERGAPMSLVEMAERFEAAGVATAGSALAQLERCRPARAPLYRDGDVYGLDPHDGEADAVLVRLGLAGGARPVEVAIDADVALSQAELDEAWKGAYLTDWTRTSLALAVLDAHGGPREPSFVIAAVTLRTRWHDLDDDPAKFRRRDSAIAVLEDGRWAVAGHASGALQATRERVRRRVRFLRRQAAARWRLASRHRAMRGTRLAMMSRAVLARFPPDRPVAVAVLDVGARTIATYTGDALESARDDLARFDMLCAVDVRAGLRALGVDPGARRLGELGPACGELGDRELVERVIRSSCRIRRPLSDARALAHDLRRGNVASLLAQLENDVKSLYALHEYGMLHGYVRVPRGRLFSPVGAQLELFASGSKANVGDDGRSFRIAARWVHPAEPVLRDLAQCAMSEGVPLEVVVGAAPSWDRPWRGSRVAHVRANRWGWLLGLDDDDGEPIDLDHVQRARVAMAVH